MDSKISKKVEKFKKDFGIDPEPFELCPRFESCSVNRCPLHSDFKKLESSENDQEQKCTMERNVRKKIGIAFNLKNNGLTDRELDGEKRSIQMRELNNISPQANHISNTKKKEQTMPVSLSQLDDSKIDEQVLERKENE